MSKSLLRALALGLVLVAGVVALIFALASGGDSGSPASSTTRARVGDSFDRALQLIRDCRVRSTVSLHSGVFYLALKDGSRVDLPSASEHKVYVAISGATKRCRGVTISME